jgi:vitamin B12 transporter
VTTVLLLVALVVQDTVVLKPVVVTATRVPTPADAVTAAVTVISGASLRERGIRTVGDALRETLGATVVETGGPGSQTSLFLRGGESDYVKVLLDGVPLNQPGGAYSFAHLTTDDVERIEIVRGPVSVLYGSDAVAGVIQIFTRTGLGGGVPRVDAEAGAGTYGASRVGGTVTGGGGTARLGYSLGFSRFASDGLFPVNNSYRNSVVTARLRVAPDARTDAAITVRHGDGVFHYPTDGAGRIVDANQFATDRGPALAMDFGRRVTGRFETRLLVGASESDARLDDDPDGAGDTTLIFHSRDRVRRRSAELRANWQAGPAALFTAGVALADAQLRHTDACRFYSSGAFFDCSGAPMDRTRSTRAVFLQWLGLGRPVSANVGARLEDNQQFGTFVTWRAGAAWRLDAATRLRAAAGSGFKEPTFVETYSTGFVIGNPNLRPERSFSWEGGIEHAVPGTSLSLAVTYFDQRFRDLVVYDFTRTPNYVNIAAARATGAEVAVDWIVRSGVVASLAYTYLDTRVLDGGGDPTFETGKRLIRRPANAATLRLSSRLGRRGTASLGARFVGDREDLDFSTYPAPRVTLHPYTRVQAAVEYVVLPGRRGAPGGGLTLEAQGENLLGDRGREIANFPVRGRTLFFGMRLGTGNEGPR